MVSQNWFQWGGREVGNINNLSSQLGCKIASFLCNIWVFHWGSLSRPVPFGMQLWRKLRESWLVGRLFYPKGVDLLLLRIPSLISPLTFFYCFLCLQGWPTELRSCFIFFYGVIRVRKLRSILLFGTKFALPFRLEAWDFAI